MPTETDRPPLAVPIDTDIVPAKHAGAILREHGLKVNGIVEEQTPEPLLKVCKRLVFIDNLEECEAPPARKSIDALPLIYTAKEKITQDDKWFGLCGIGKTIQAAHPEFDGRSYGYAKLSARARDIPLSKVRSPKKCIQIRRIG